MTLVHAIRQRCSGRLVDDALHVEAGDLAGILGGLALHVVEVGGNGYDRFRDSLAEIGLRVGLQFLQDHCRDLLRRVLLALDLDDSPAVLALHDLVRDGRTLGLGLLEPAPDEALDRCDRVLRIRDRLVLRGLPDDPFAFFAEGHDAGRRAVTLRVDDDRRLAALQDSHRRVGRTEVDPQHLAHLHPPLPSQ